MMITTLTRQPDTPVALIDAQMLYPSFNVRVMLAGTKHELGMVDHLHKVDLLINSKHEDQKTAAQKTLDSLMDALGLEMPELAKHQPTQVVAATYARLLKQQSWCGWLFKEPLQTLKLVNVTVTSGVSTKHKKHYCNYSFAATDQTIDRSKTLVRGYSAEDSWWYRSQLHPKALKELPQNFLLWFTADKIDRTDNEDFEAVSECLGISNHRLMKAVFYQIKFEMADVIVNDYYYNRHSANEPANIFAKNVDPHASLAGLLILHEDLLRIRPLAREIYYLCSHDLLPNHCWNGKWERVDIRKKVS